VARDRMAGAGRGGRGPPEPGEIPDGSTSTGIRKYARFRRSPITA
jgi:hypothetical protein